MEDYVNSVQSKEERREKYNKLRKAGANYIQARKWRDFHNSTLERKIYPMLKENEVKTDSRKICMSDNKKGVCIAGTS